MLTTEAVLGVLKAAGFQAAKLSKRKRIDGVQVIKHTTSTVAVEYRNWAGGPYQFDAAVNALRSAGFAIAYNSFGPSGGVAIVSDSRSVLLSAAPVYGWKVEEV